LLFQAFMTGYAFGGIMRLLFSVMLFWANFAFATEPFGLPAQDPRPVYEKKGDVFSIRLVPADKETRLYIVGNEAVAVKFDDVKVTGRVRFGDREKVITFNRKDDYFTTSDQLAGDVDLSLKNKKKAEKFKFQIKNP
jgi:hypothetical protein